MSDDKKTMQRNINVNNTWNECGFFQRVQKFSNFSYKISPIILTITYVTCIPFLSSPSIRIQQIAFRHIFYNSNFIIDFDECLRECMDINLFIDVLKKKKNRLTRVENKVLKHKNSIA